MATELASELASGKRHAAGLLGRLNVRTGIVSTCARLLLGTLMLISGTSRVLADNEPVVIHSQSGQFAVHGLPMGPPPHSSTSVVQYLRLDPNLTAISLERIRQAIQSELDWPNKWRGLITVVTEPVRGENTRVTIVSQRYTDGWRYRILFPELVEKERFLNAAVKTILTEFANRRALIREAELPEWLVEGLTAELAATSLPMLALEPAAEVNRRGQNPDALAEVRELLRQRTPLSFDDLSMPDDNMLAGESAARFRACAHLFVHELLHLRDGRACLRRMLERLPDNLNWQTTFLQSFENHFSSLLDVDQWYALSVAGIRGRDPSSIFPPETTRQQLDGILATSVEVRVAAQELPLRMDLKLQRLIAEWEFPRQHAVLVEKISRLQTLKNRAAPEMLDAVNGYLDALLEYVGSRNLAPPRTDRQRERLRPRGTAGKLIEQLDRLDARRLPEVAPPR